MGVLEKIKEMRNQGIPDEDITKKLQEQGISPKAIMDAFNQEQIKNAVSAESSDGENNMNLSIPKPGQQTQGAGIGGQQFYRPRSQEMNESAQDYYEPYSTQSQGMQQPPQQYNYPETDQYDQEEYYPQQSYSQDYYSQPQGYSADTQIEIAEQVFSEKIKKIQKQIDSMTEFAKLAETKISNNHERIKRIENTMDKLQISILDKIGDYGKNITGIKNEMQMMQDSFSKMLPELKGKHHKK